MAEKQCNLLKNGGGMSKISVTENKSVNVTAGTNTDVTLTNNFNNPDFIRIGLYAGTLCLVSQIMTYEEFKTQQVRLCYNSTSLSIVDVTYASDSKIHATVNSMPSGASYPLKILSYDLL